MQAVSPDKTGSALAVKVFPPVVYPVEVELTSLVFVGSAVPSVVQYMQLLIYLKLRLL
jgi:hypothetical protein